MRDRAALALLLAASSVVACGSGDSEHASSGSGGGGAGSSSGAGGDGAGSSATPTTTWAKRFDAHSLFGDQGPAVAVDADGNLYATGSLHGVTGSLGGPELSNPTEHWDDVFVASFSPDGAPRWSHRYGADYGDDGHAIAVDAAGDVLVTGFLSQEGADFGGGPLAKRGAFVASFTAGGAHRWSVAFGDATSDSRGLGIAADASGNVYVTGRFFGTLDFGGGPVTANGATFDKSDVFVASYDADGAYRWAHTFGDAESAVGHGLAVAAGMVAVVGTFRGTVDFGGGALTAKPDTSAIDIAGDAFVAAFSTAGDPLWSKAFASPAGEDDEQARAVALDAQGNALVAGTIGRISGGAVDFGGGPIGGGGYGDAFVASFDAKGAHRWSKAMGKPAPFVDFDAAADAAGSFYVAGAFAEGRYVVSLGSDGAERWSASTKTSSPDDQAYAFGVAVDPAARVDVIGHFTGTVDVGGTSLTSADAQEVFLVQLAQP